MRVVVEQTFGTLKSRFRCLHDSGHSLQYHPVKCARIAIACKLLHNICIQRRIPLDEPLVDHEDPGVDAYRGEEQTGQARRRSLIGNVFSYALGFLELAAVDGVLPLLKLHII